MNNLILVRHGQSQWNLEKRFTGWADIDLTAHGKSEAEYAGKLIKKLNIQFDGYFTSNLKRAINSLNIILKILDQSNTEIVKNTALNERHYGALTSLNRDEIIKKYGDEQVKKWRRSFDIRPPKMESNHVYKNKINLSAFGIFSLVFKNFLVISAEATECRRTHIVVNCLSHKPVGSNT